MKKTISLYSASRSRFCLARRRSQGSDSGEAFREDFLIPALKERTTVEVDLSGVVCSASFLEEAFAGLVRDGVLTKKDFKKRIKLVSKANPMLIDEIMQYVGEVEGETPSIVLSEESEYYAKNLAKHAAVKI